MSMINARSVELLTEAAAAFQDGTSPFDGWWLTKHTVTADECVWLANFVGVVLLGFVRSSEQTQKKVLILGVTEGELDSRYVDSAIDVAASMRKMRGPL